jgi:hypothetical protein
MRNLNISMRNKDLFDHIKYEAAKSVYHSIDTGDPQPTCQPPHRVSPKERQMIKEMTEEVLSYGVIQPSTGLWASRIVLVKKKDGRKRSIFKDRKLFNSSRR